jgi:hypothetical protein
LDQPRVVRHSTDIVLKLIAAALGGDLFARFGVPLPSIVDALPTELPQLEVRTQHTDQLFRLADDSILHLEFQTTLRRGEFTLCCLQPGHLPAVRAAGVDHRALRSRHPQRP